MRRVAEEHGLSRLSLGASLAARLRVGEGQVDQLPAAMEVARRAVAGKAPAHLLVSSIACLSQRTRWHAVVGPTTTAGGAAAGVGLLAAAARVDACIRAALVTGG